MIATFVTTLDLTSITQLMDVSMEWNYPTSGSISQVNNLTRAGAMGACIYSTSSRVIRTPATSRRFRKAGKMMGRS